MTLTLPGLFPVIPNAVTLPHAPSRRRAHPDEGSSAGAALRLLEKGWQNVHTLYGGFDAWRDAGLPVDPG